MILFQIVYLIVFRVTVTLNLLHGHKNGKWHLAIKLYNEKIKKGNDISCLLFFVQ